MNYSTSRPLHLGALLTVLGFLLAGAGVGLVSAA